MTDINRITYTLFIYLFFSCQTSAQKKEIFKITKSDQQWRNELTERQYMVLRKSATEQAFSSPLNKIYSHGQIRILLILI